MKDGWQLQRAGERVWLSLRGVGDASARGTPIRPEIAARLLDAWFAEDRSVFDRSTLLVVSHALNPAARGWLDATSRKLKDVLRDGLVTGRLVATRELLEVQGFTRAEVALTRMERTTKEPESITNPRWSDPRVPVGTSLFAIVTYTEIKAPVAATIVVREVDRSGDDKIVDRVKTTIPTGSGDHKVKWRRNPDDAQKDLEEDLAAQDDGPLEYRFRVESEDPKCTETSGPLWLTNTVDVNLVKERDRNKHERPRTVVLTDALREDHRARSKEGKVKFEEVLVGPMRLRVATPRFHDLSWSTQRVPVGEPARAEFAYADAIKGLKAQVVVYEVNHDGSAEEVDRLKLTLDAPEGRASIEFTRSEAQAQADIRADAAEGDSGPIEYRYRVVADGEESELSEELWLTHTVTIALSNTAKGKAFPAGMDSQPGWRSSSSRPMERSTARRSAVARRSSKRSCADR